MREGRLEDVHQSIPHNRVCSRFLFDFIRAGEFGKKKKRHLYILPRKLSNYYPNPQQS